MTQTDPVILSISEDEVDRLRSETPGVGHVRHFNHSGSSLPPKLVLNTVIDHLQLEAQIGGYEAADKMSDQLDEVYAQTAALVGSDPGEVALGENATRGWSMVVYGIPFQPGDRVVTTMAEYGSNVLALMQLQKRGLELVVAPNDASGQVDLDRLADLLDDRVRAVLVTHMPTSGGLIQPAKEIGDIVRREAPAAWYVLDACQTVGQMPLDMQDIQCDALSATSRKFLRGPRGSGFVSVREERLNELEPPMIDNHAAVWTATDAYELVPGARRFETFESNVAARLGMGEAIRYARAIGLKRIQRRIGELSEQFRQRLSSLDGITLRDQGMEQGGIVSFTHDQIAPEEIREHLAARNINVSVSRVASIRYDMESRNIDSLVRASVHVITTDEDIDALGEGIDELIRSRTRSGS